MEGQQARAVSLVSSNFFFSSCNLCHALTGQFQSRVGQRGGANASKVDGVDGRGLRKCHVPVCVWPTSSPPSYTKAAARRLLCHRLHRTGCLAEASCREYTNVYSRVHASFIVTVLSSFVVADCGDVVVEGASRSQRAEGWRSRAWP